MKDGRGNTKGPHAACWSAAATKVRSKARETNGVSIAVQQVVLFRNEQTCGHGSTRQPERRQRQGGANSTFLPRGSAFCCGGTAAVQRAGRRRFIGRDQFKRRIHSDTVYCRGPLPPQCEHASFPAMSANEVLFPQIITHDTNPDCVKDSRLTGASLQQHRS